MRLAPWWPCPPCLPADAAFRGGRRALAPGRHRCVAGRSRSCRRFPPASPAHAEVPDASQAGCVHGSPGCRLRFTHVARRGEGARGGRRDAGLRRQRSRDPRPATTRRGACTSGRIRGPRHRVCTGDTHPTCSSGGGTSAPPALPVWISKGSGSPGARTLVPSGEPRTRTGPASPGSAGGGRPRGDRGPRVGVRTSPRPQSGNCPFNSASTSLFLFCFHQATLRESLFSPLFNP